MSNGSRYLRQEAFRAIGREGQNLLGESRVVIVGAGAMGAASSTLLARAGVGHLTIIDRDFLEIHNLQRQILYTDADVASRLPKATLAAEHLRQINPEIEVLGVVADYSPENAEELSRGADLLIDGLDNLESRFLINDVSLKLGIPWIYGGALGASGMVAVFLPGARPCFRCLMEPPSGSVPTCDTAGIVGGAPVAVAAIQSAEAMKLLTGSTPSPGLLSFDLWTGTWDRIEFERWDGEHCPACEGRYEYLEQVRGSRVATLCGQNAVQVWNPQSRGFNLEELAERLRPLGEVNLSIGLLHFRPDERELAIFNDGRVVVRGTSDAAEARAMVARYLGI